MLLARTVRVPDYGVFVQWRSGWTTGADWRYAWLDEIPDPAAINTLCGPCRGMVWLVDLTDPARPQRRTPPAAMR